jgi:hypothetical protein
MTLCRAWTARNEAPDFDGWLRATSLAAISLVFPPEMLMQHMAAECGRSSAQ